MVLLYIFNLHRLNENIDKYILSFSWYPCQDFKGKDYFSDSLPYNRRWVLSTADDDIDEDAKSYPSQ